MGSTTITSANKKADEQKALASRNRKLMFSAAIAGVSLAILIGYAWQRRNSCATEPQKGAAQDVVDRSFQFDKSGDIKGAKAAVLSEDELLKLAKGAKEAGLVVQGVTQCGWTRKQREMFGDASSQARKVFESMYIECRSRDMCPNVRGYPTWTRGDQMFPGFKDVDKIRELIKEVGPLPVQQQVRGAAEPNEANIPDVKPTVKSAALPQAVKDVDSANLAEQTLHAGSGSKTGAQDAEEDDEENKKENVRGVSNYPPLNVPDMPGTKPMTINKSHVVNQWDQGNIPRQALDNPDPKKEIADQMASTFQQIAYDASRDPGDAAFSAARLPQSSHITSGDPLDDKRIYVEKN